MRRGVTFEDLTPQPFHLVPSGVTVIGNRHFMQQANNKVNKIDVLFAQKENTFPVPTDWYFF